MAFQTSFLRDGEWVTETVNFQAALQQATVSVPGPALERHLELPACGILSKTVVESPIVRWVLPVRLRSNTHNDVAFIGVSPITYTRAAPSPLVASFVSWHLFLPPEPVSQLAEPESPLCHSTALVIVST